MTRVTGVESGQVITTGVVNMRRFEQRPTETLVLGELLDRRVRLVETGEEVTVLDVGDGSSCRPAATGRSTRSSYARARAGRCAARARR